MLPTDTYHIESMNLSHFFNGDGVQILYQPAAHTDGDSMVYFRGSDVLATGDIFTPERYPIIDLARGGSIQGEIDALNRILDIAIPEFRLEGGTLVIPGHGRLCDSADVAYYRDMVTIIRDRIQAMMKKDMTLDQIKAAKPTLDYDGIYGATTGIWTTDMFIEAVYKSLANRKEIGPKQMKHGMLCMDSRVCRWPCCWLRQRGGKRSAAAAARRPPKEAAPVDLTGYWVSVVTEDWRYRMMTPAKGDYPSIPLNPEGRKVADAWDPAKDEAPASSAKRTAPGASCACPGACTSPGRTTTR